ncbi:copia protein [Tanacetum coccineum]
MYKLDPVILAPKVKNNREAHEYYLKHTMEQVAILREIVEQAKSLNPLDSTSYSAYKYVKLIQELLGYVRDTCPDIHKRSEKLVTVTPINQKKTVRSMSTDNTKNDRILQISSSTQKKNKVEDHSRIVKSCLNKPNCVVEPSRNANVQHSKLNKNSELMCVKCNGSMFDARHELCFLEFVFDMNERSKSKSVKKAKKKEEWKLQEKITSTNKVPLREPIPLEVIAQESVVTKVYTRRSKVPKTSGSNSKLKIAKSMISNKMEPYTSRGSNTSVAPSSSSSSVDLSYCKSVGISHETSVARYPQQNGIVERRNGTLVEAARTMLIYAKAPIFRWTEKTRSILPLCLWSTVLSKNNSEDLGKLQAKADIGIFIGYAPKKKSYRIYNRRLVSNHILQQPCNPPPRDDWDCLFQPMFDEYFNPLTIAVSPVPVAAAPRAVARIEAICIFVANAANKNMTIFQMDVKTEFLNDKNALYGLKQAPHAWYDMLSSFLISQDFSKGAVDPTLFTQKSGNDLLMFKMSMMGQMSFFLGLQISQSPRGIFLNQSKYAFEIIKKYGLQTSNSVDTPMVEKNKLDEDLQGTPIDPTLYHGMIGSLMYLTSSRHDLMEPLTWVSGTRRMLEQVENGIVELYFVRTKYQLADIFTKPLPRERFNFLIEKLGLRNMSPKMLKRLTEEEDKTMNPTAAEQIALDNTLVALETRLTIGKCNSKILFSKPQREATYQVTLDALKLSPCYPEFLITAEVPEIYMHQFWNSVNKVQSSSSYHFKIDNKKFKIDVEVFRNILQICPKLPD